MKQITDDVMAQRAKKTAEKRNRDKFDAAIASATLPQIADFITENFDLLENFSTRLGLDLDLTIDALRGQNEEIHLPTLKTAKAMLSRFVRNEDISTLKSGPLKIRLSDPDVLIANQKNTQAHYQEARDLSRAALRHGRDFSVSLLKYGTNLTSHLLGAAGNAATGIGKATWHGAGAAWTGWNALLTYGGLGGLGRGVVNTTIAGSMVAFMAVPIDATPHATVLGHTIAQADLHRVCLDTRIMGADPITAAFAIAHGDHGADVDMIYRASLNAGLTHGVAPEALFYIAHYETNGFRDLVANNSSATNPWQMIDSTKFGYIKAYGQKTQTYQDAKQRLADGTSQLPDRDRMVVSAIDAVVSASQATLDTALANTRFTPTQFAALNLANDMTFAAELVALDIHKKAPALRADNVASLSVQKRLQLTASYYAPDHFLGATNMRYASRLASEAPATRLTNTSQVASLIGNSGARKLNAVVTSNPGLLPTNITAAQLIPRITEYFANKVTPVVDPVKATSVDIRNAFELCVINPEKKRDGPIMASRAEIAYAISASYVSHRADQLSTTFASVRNLSLGVTQFIPTFKTGGNAPIPTPM